MRQKVKVTIDIIDLRGEGIHVFAPAFVCGIPIKMLIDTGASRTIFDLNFIEKKLNQILVEQINEMVHGFNPADNHLYSATLPDVYFNTVSLKKPVVRLLDLTYINNLYQQLGISPIQGIIGSDWLHYCRAIIDYSTCKLKLRIPLEEQNKEPELLIDFTTTPSLLPDAQIKLSEHDFLNEADTEHK